MADHAALEQFISGLEGFAGWADTKQIDHLIYFSTISQGADGVTAAELATLFGGLFIKVPSRLAQHLSENAKGRTARYVKRSKGYRLSRVTAEEIKAGIGVEPTRIHVSQQLLELVSRVQDAQERTFLEEAIKCYQVEAFRAAIILVWIVTFDHLQKYVFNQKLADFNAALSKNPAGKIKIVSTYDEFSELKEVKIIEVMRAAMIISNDVRKILEEKLDIRNSAAHPSGIVFRGHKTTEFALDLIENVLLKY